MQVRTRFAPSPTGYMHIGNVRTAIFAWLYAKATKGKFILRIEDTDLERSREECIQVILDGFEWLGIEYDEGPYYQTERMARYKALIQQMLDEDKAYRCYCSKERLDKLRQCQLEQKAKPQYDRKCRDLKERLDCPFVVRFCNPKEGSVIVHDLIHGEVEFQNSELDDLIIARGDGSPTYNFCVVVDDMDMGVTHVIRGDDHLNNTPRQINIFEALGAKPPAFAHVPMILGSDGKRLSKRHGAVGLREFRDEGYLPQALINYLVRLGWSHGDQEIFSREEMIELFNLDHLNKAPAAINSEKLLWLNQHYIKELKPEIVGKELKWQMDKLGIDMTKGPDLREVVMAQAERCKTLKEMAEKSRYFYEDFEQYNEKAARKNLKPETANVLEQIMQKLEALKKWQPEPIHKVIIDTAETLGLKLGKVAQPIRVAITGGTISPPIDITLTLIGKERVLARLQKAIERCGRGVARGV